MIQTRSCFALLVLLVSGCAGAPEQPPAALATAAPRAAPADAAAASVTPDLVVDASELIARTPTPPICRQVLKQGSNVIVTQCMSAAAWKGFERRQAEEAAIIVRMLQGGRYR